MYNTLDYCTTVCFTIELFFCTYTSVDPLLWTFLLWTFFCGSLLWISSVDFFCGSLLCMDLFCGPLLWTSSVDLFCRPSSVDLFCRSLLWIFFCVTVPTAVVDSYQPIGELLCCVHTYCRGGFLSALGRAVVDCTYINVWIAASYGVGCCGLYIYQHVDCCQL